MAWTWLTSLSQQLELPYTESASWGNGCNTLVDTMFNTMNPWV